MSTPTKTKATAVVTDANTAAPATQPVPRAVGQVDLTLGQTVMVQLAPGAMLRNTETGGFFEPDQAMPQTVTVTLLRRLQDGDLVLA